MTDFTKYNYEELVQAVTDKVKDANGWGDGYTSSMGQTIIQTVAFTVDQLHYMLERRNQESYLPTAVLPSSIRSIANAQGYRPRRKVSSRGTVRLDLKDENGAPTSTVGSINIPRYTRIVWENNEFLTNEDVTIEPGESYAEFEIVQGTFQQYTEDPSDTTTNLYKHNFVLFEEYINIEDTTLEVEVDGEKYFDVAEEHNNQPALESLSFAGENDRVYDIRIANDGLRVLFGSGLFGKFPEDSVVVTWVESRGSEVNIRRTGIEFSFENNTLEDDIQQTPRNTYYYTMTNIENIDGGLDEEDTRTIKAKAPEFVRTGNRAVTKDDYVFWGKRSGIGGIVDVFVYGEEETGVTAFNMNNVYMTYLKNDGSKLNTTEQDNLRTYMNGFKPITTHLVFREAEQIPLKINLTVRRHPKLEISNSELHMRLRDELEGMFTFKEGSLAEDFFYSELINRFHTLQLEKNGKVYDMTRYVFASVQPTKPFSVPSVEPLVTDSAYSITLAVGNDGDEYSLDLVYTDNNDDLQNAEVSYTQQSGDSSSVIASDLQAQIDALSGLTATVNSSTIMIDVENAGDEYTISNRNSTQPQNIPVEAIVFLPIRILNNENNLELITPGSVEIRENAGNFSLLGTDDGAGSITISGNSGSIDYTTGKMVIPVYQTGDYVIIYDQDNDEQNVFANPKSVITYQPAKKTINTSKEELSTIEIIT